MIHIKAEIPLSNYVEYVLRQFKEQGVTEIILKGVGETMGKIISVAEIVKYRVKGLYQINKIGSQTNRFEKTVTFYTITLTKTPPKDKTCGF